MIVVKVELHSAVTGQVSVIGSMVIANDGSGTSDIGNYEGAIKTEYGTRKFRRINFRRKTRV